MSEITLKLKTPETPNFIIIGTTPGMRQEGFQEAPKVSVADLTDIQLGRIADEWKENLLMKARKIREAR